METITERIMKIALKLLVEERVDAVLGYQRGTIPMMSQPILIREPEHVDRFHWDSHCSSNLATYLPKRRERLAVVSKGCDSRNIVLQILENQIRREQLYIIGVPCQGMIDKQRIGAAVTGEIREVAEADGKVIVKGFDFEKALAKSEVLQQNCSVCIHRNPVIYDELVADLGEEQKDVDRYADVREIEALDAQQKWDYFDNLLSACIRCYACRNACPLCYCPTCFVDESRPQWVGKSQDPMDVRTFHFLRAFHCAGRCTDCGACQRACPVGINMRVFTKKLEKDCFDQFGWEAGLTLDQRPPLDTYRPEDPDEFIK